jgi:hypothetical protein
MLPPKDVKPSELFRKLCEIPRPSEVVDFPRKDPETGEPVGKVRVQVLTMVQHDDARMKAYHWLKDQKKVNKEDLESTLLQEVYGDRVAREVLAMCCLTENPIAGTVEAGKPKYGRLFRNAGDLDTLSADELTVLFTTYEMVQNKYGPNAANIESDEELNAWIEVLSEGAATFPLAGRSWHQLASLCLSLAERAYSLSALVGSLSGSWPDTFAAPLRSWGIGTGSYGGEHAAAIRIGLVLSSQPKLEQDESAAQIEIPALPDEPITTEEAVALSKRLFAKG